MNIKEIRIKNIISPSKLPDADFVINPYVGCLHACMYCYADFMKKFSGHQDESWGSFVDIKINAPDTVHSINKNKNILIGSVTDPYQAVEAKYFITRKILQELIPLQPKIEILTKSALVVRDYDLFKQFDNVKIGISFSTLDNKIARMLEPGASSPQARLCALETLSQQGIPSYVFISPVFPGLTDVQSIMRKTKEFTSDYLCENLNITSSNKKNIMSMISHQFPHLISTYKSMLSDKSLFWSDFIKNVTDYAQDEGVTCKTYIHQ